MVSRDGGTVKIKTIIISGAETHRFTDGGISKSYKESIIYPSSSASRLFLLNSVPIHDFLLPSRTLSPVLWTKLNRSHLCSLSESVLIRTLTVFVIRQSLTGKKIYFQTVQL